MYRRMGELIFGQARQRVGDELSGLVVVPFIQCPQKCCMEVGFLYRSAVRSGIVVHRFVFSLCANHARRCWIPVSWSCRGTTGRSSCRNSGHVCIGWRCGRRCGRSRCKSRMQSPHVIGRYRRDAIVLQWRKHTRAFVTAQHLRPACAPTMCIVHFISLRFVRPIHQQDRRRKDDRYR